MTSMKKNIYTFPEALRVCRQHNPETGITMGHTKQAFPLEFFRCTQLPINNTLGCLMEIYLP